MSDNVRPADIKVGQAVRAFHPGMFGVIREGEVVRCGSKYVHIDFGPLLGNVQRVLYRHVTVITG